MDVLPHTPRTPRDGVSEKDNVAQMCELVAKEIGNMLLSEVKRLAEDMRQQYRDHYQFLAKQELIFQQLVGRVQRLSEQNLPTMNATLSRNEVAMSSFQREMTPLCTEPDAAVLNPTDLEKSNLTLTDRNTSADKFPSSDRSQCTGDDKSPRSAAVVAVHSVDKSPRSVAAVAAHSVEDPVLQIKSAKSGRPRSHVAATSTSCSAECGKNRSSMNRYSVVSSSQSYKTRRGDMFGKFADEKKLDQLEYNVCDFYWETGYCQQVARSDLFANVTLGVIGANAIYIGIDADRNDKENLLDADISFLICENAFCAFFTFEWLVRFGSFRKKFDSLKDLWFVFDTCLVAMMIIETWILPFCFSGGTGIPTGLVKMLRLLRLARMARVMRAFPDLMAMIKGVGVASRAVGSALLMLILLVYVFAIILFTLLKDETNEQIHERFNRLGLVMWTLLIDGAFMDGIGFISRAMIAEGHYLSIAVLVVFVLCSALTVMNMLIGVLCQVVSAVAASEKEDHAIRIVKSELLSMLKEMDQDCSGFISRDEMSTVLNNEGALSTLINLNVDVDVLMEQLEMKFDEYGELTIYAIMDLILMLRGDRPPTMKDMLDSLTFTRWKIAKIAPWNADQITRTRESEGSSPYKHSLMTPPREMSSLIVVESELIEQPGRRRI